MHTKQKCPDERQSSPVSSADAASLRALTHAAAPEREQLDPQTPDLKFLNYQGSDLDLRCAVCVCVWGGIYRDKLLEG